MPLMPSQVSPLGLPPASRSLLQALYLLFGFLQVLLEGRAQLV